ncbi:MAG: SDR family NAD(P)-dependent oxidoreductase, partial [Pirellulales bacterium]
MRTIRGKQALVTGAASGLGRAIALQLAQEGADLFLVDIDRRGLDDVVDAVRHLGVSALGRTCDLTSPEQITASTDAVLAEWGGVDILVNNAGVAYYGPTLNMTPQQWDWLLAINLRAPIQLTLELLPTLLDRPEAHVVNMASITGLVAGGRFCAYHVSKFGLVGFSEAIRAEFGRQGLGVSTICPGPVLTNLYRAAPSGHADRSTPHPPAWICTTP